MKSAVFLGSGSQDRALVRAVAISLPQLLLFPFHTQITLEALPGGQVLWGDKEWCEKLGNLSHCTIISTSNLLLGFVTHPGELN